MTVEEQIAFEGQLAYPVVADGGGRVALVHGDGAHLAVTGAAGRGVEEFADLVFHRQFEQAQGAEDVDASVKEGFADGAAHIHLRGMVIDDFGALAGEHGLDPGRVRNVATNEAGRRRQVFFFAGGEVVDNGHVMARGEIALRHVRGDETCASGYQYFHKSLGFNRVPRAA